MTATIGAHRRNRLRRAGANTVARALSAAPGTDLTFAPDAIVAQALEAGELSALDESEIAEALEIIAEPLSVICEDFAGPAQLNAFGRLTAHAQLVKNVSNHLECVDWLKGNETAAAASVDVPLIVVGLPRTGTTLLQQMLALDPKSRVLRAWHAQRLVPPPAAPVDEHDPRYRDSVRGFRLLNRVSPEATGIHHVEPQLPTECVALLANTIGSLEHAGIHNVTGHLEWVANADLGPHYDSLLDQLRVPQTGYSPRRWVLKSPAHLLALGELAKRLPNARFVWTHRDPLKAIASHASLTSVLIRVGSNRLDQVDLGRRWAELWSSAYERAQQDRASIGEDRFFDLEHSDLVADPTDSLERIYRWMGWDSELLRESWVDYVNRHPRDGAGRHTYRPEDFGLSAGRVADLFPGADPTTQVSKH